MMSRNSNRSGFTLVELLVVIAIIGILVGMHLPAVQQVREAARRTACINKNRQIGLALANYQSARLRLPPGAIWQDIDNNGQVGGLESFSFFVQILPEIEQQSIYDSYFNGADNALTLSRDNQLDLLLCPSATTNDELNTSHTNSSAPGNVSHYLGVTGMTHMETVDGPVVSSVVLSGNNYGGFLATNGVFGASLDLPQLPMNGDLDHRAAYTTKTAKNYSDIRDGTSNTILLAENSKSEVISDDNPALSFIPVRSGWAFGYETNDNNQAILHCGRSATIGNSFNLNRSINLSNSSIITSGNLSTSILHNSFPFNSNHAGGVIITLADGSTRFLADTIEQVTLRRLSSIASGEVIDSLE